MLNKEVLKIKDLITEFSDDSYLVKIIVENPGERTLYAYASPRRIQYDTATKTLIVSFHDEHIDADDIIGQHLMEPKILVVEGKTNGEIRVKFPEVIKRIKSANETGGKFEIEEIRARDADNIKVEIAHQDTPFYFNPKLKNAEQLKDWGSMVVHKSFKVKENRKKSE